MSLWTTPAGPPGFLLVSRSPFTFHPARKPPGDTITPPVSSQKAFRLLHPAPWTPSCAVDPVVWSSPPEGRAGRPRSGRAPSLGGLYQAWWEKGPERCDFLSPSPGPARPGAPAGVVLTEAGRCCLSETAKEGLGALESLASPRLRLLQPALGSPDPVQKDRPCPRASRTVRLSL